MNKYIIHFLIFLNCKKYEENLTKPFPADWAKNHQYLPQNVQNQNQKPNKQLKKN